MKNLRTHGKSTIVWLLLGLLVLGLGGFGVTSFSGGQSGIGAVGDTKVTADEYARALRNQIAAYSRQTGQPLSMAQAQAMGVPQSVQAQLFTGAALEEQARLIGVSVGDARVRQTILDADAFKGATGDFDRAAYAEVLGRERMSEAQFERAVRGDEARLMIQRAVIGGAVAPQPMVAQTAQWLLETRDMAWCELTEDMLPAPIAAPDEATLEAWHKANADRFTAPETKKITYLWLTPEMLAGEVELDEDALRAAYDERIDQYRQPERRMVSRLVFPDMESAEAAKAAIDNGSAPFEQAVIQRGLTLEDVDLGEMREDQLGAAGAAVFALEGPGVAGPVETDLGPALFAMNAILDPINVPFEEAREELRSEAAADRAARMIDDRSAEFEDLLAGGATLEDVAKETTMQLGQIDWTGEAGADADGGAISGYQAFREAAGKVAASDFPELVRLDDGGVFALRLDEVVAPALKPFAEVRDAVAADWRAAELHRQLLELAEDKKLEATAATTPVAAPAPAPETASRVATPAEPDQPGVMAQAADSTDPAAEAADPASPWTIETGLRRDGWIDGVPGEVVSHAFALDQPAEVETVDTEDRVFLIRLDAIHAADLQGEEATQVLDGVRARMGQSLQADLFDYYARAAQLQGGLVLDQSVINAVNAQVQ